MGHAAVYVDDLGNLLHTNFKPMNTNEFMAETIFKSGLGLLGAVTSWNLAQINQVASLAVALLTAGYLIIQIKRALSNGDRDEQ